MKREEVMKQYKVDQNGIIRSPGKFEGEMLYIPHFWGAFLDGMADDDDGKTLSFNVDAEDIKEYPELTGVHRVTLVEDDTGFVHGKAIGARHGLRKLSAVLDRVASSLESKGLLKEAAEVDVISNTLEKNAYVSGEYELYKYLKDTFGAAYTPEVEKKVEELVEKIKEDGYESGKFWNQP